jgi:rsbT co-antagonist protein RsbR
MSETSATILPDLIRSNETRILADWVNQQLQSLRTRRDLISDDELRRESKEFLAAFARAVDEGGVHDLRHPSWNAVRDHLSRLSHTRAKQGFTTSEIATFVFSLKQPLFTLLRQEVNNQGDLANDMWAVTTALDALGLHTTEVYQKSREEIINRQSHEMLELSTPVVTLWDGVLALPLIGTLDSARTQVVLENLLQRIVETGSAIAILDITGVPTVDTLVAQHLLKTVSAARLMGADCIISGIRPQIAQTIVHLGVDLNSVITKATLADAFAVALKRLGLGVAKLNGRNDGQRTAAAGQAPPTAPGI